MATAPQSPAVHPLERAHLGSIWLYPIKGFDGIAVSEAEVLPSGALRHDRQWAFFDSSGRPINGKRFPRIHQIRLHTLALAQGHFEIWDTQAEQRSLAFQAQRDTAELEAWVSSLLKTDVRLRENTASGFPDDPDSSGPTLVSSASLASVAAWFCGLAPLNVRGRFRSNLELIDCPAFAEDALLASEDKTMGPVFQLGPQVPLMATGPCPRCPVPTRDPMNGAEQPDFIKRFSAERAACLPSWAPAQRFTNAYRLAINTVPAPGSAGGMLAVGDRLILPPR